MRRLQILARSSLLPPKAVDALNRELESFVRVVEFELADTGFYKKTRFSTLKLTFELLNIIEPEIVFDEDLSYDALDVQAKIPISQFDLNMPRSGFEHTKEQAARALAAVVTHYGLESRMLDIRAFHISQGAKARRTERVEVDEINSSEYRSNVPVVIPVKRYEIETSGSAYIGRFGSQNQFWAQVVAVFRKPSAVSADGAGDWATRKYWYAILHKFDVQGNHLATDFKFVGTTADGESAILTEAKKHMDNFIEALGPVVFGDIAIRLFSVDIDGHTFGMIDSSSSEWGDTVTMEPGDLVFSVPWDGEYDT